MKIADKEGTQIIAKFNFPFGDQRFNETLKQVKEINGSVFDKKLRFWKLPLTNTTYESLVSAGFDIDKKLNDWYENSLLKVTLKPKIEINGLFPFQNEGVSFVEYCQGRAFIADDMGCLTGDSLITIKRNGRNTQYELRKVYHQFHNVWDKYSATCSYTMSMSLDGKEFRFNKINNIIFKGVKIVYKIVTETHSAKATKDHVFFTEGLIEKELKDLGIGEKIYVNEGEYPNDILATIPKIEKIVSIEKIGIEDVYDIQMESPNHNFIANGIVVHNCGKTIQAIGWFNLHKDRTPIIIICPATIKEKWRAEIVQWSDFKDEDIILLSGRGSFKIPENKKIIIINYDILQYWIDSLREISPKVLIGDECFPAGTKISTPDRGNVDIEDLKVGDSVYNAVGIGKILKLYKNPISQLVKIHLSTGQTITTTPNHPFFTEVGWMNAVDIEGRFLFTQQEVLTPTLKITKSTAIAERVEILELGSYGEPSKSNRENFVYNIEVSGHPSYFVENILVHNCHAVKNDSALRTKALKILSREIPYILGLSGTPIENRPIEFFNALNIIRPDIFPNKFKYAIKFCNARKNHWGWDMSGSSNREELHKLLTDTLMIRRKKVDVLPQLPTKTRSMIPITIDNMKEYWEAERDIISWIEKNEGSSKALRAIGNEGLVSLVKLQQITSKGKIDAAISWIEDFIEETEEKLVIFCKFTKTIDILKEKFKDACVVIDGRVPPEKRMKIIDEDFVKDKKKRLFIGNIQIAVGFNLTIASNVLYIEHSFKPSHHLQSEDRCIAENSPVFCYKSKNKNSMALNKIQDIKIGDKVHTQSGQSNSVIDINSRFYKGMVTLINYVGWHEPLKCTYDHKILILRNDVIQWELAHKLLPTDYMVFPKVSKIVDKDYIEIEDKWRLYENISKPIHCIVECCTEKIAARYKRLPDKIPLNDDWLYLFGWFLAKGFSSIKKGKSKFISCAGHEKEMPILENFKKMFSTIGINSTIYYKKNSKGVELRAYSGELALWFRDWFGHLAHNKTIPEELLYLPKNKAIHILNGYLDGDGHKRKNQQEWATVSETLCWQIAMLSIRCGYIPNITTTKPKISINKNGNIIRGNYTVWHGLFTLHNKLQMQKQDDKYIYRRIRNVLTQSDKIRVYDLTVENDHSFTVGFSTVHNCLRIGSKNAVTCWYLIALKTIDEIIVRTIHKKMQIIDSIIDGIDACDEEDSALDEIISQLQKAKVKNP